MTKFVVMLGLLLSVAGASYSQQKKNTTGTPDEALFELSPYTTGYEAWLDLGQGNSMRLELTRKGELFRFQNIDSLLLVFFSDLKSLQDSLSDPQTAKRLDYIIDSAGHKKLRIRQTKPAATTYLVGDGDPALLRLQQDTVFILLPAPPDKYAKENGIQCYDRLGFFLNRYEELNGFITTGLNRKVGELQTKDGKEGWTYRNNRAWLKADPTTSARTFSSPGHEAMLSLRYHLSIQNYKNYFTPSFSLGTTVTIVNRGIRNAFSADWEPVFLFAHDAAGKLQTYRNDFLVIGYRNSKEGTPRITFLENNPDIPRQNALNLDLDFSLGYLIHSQDNYFVKHTFRLCVGSVSLAKRGVVFQPAMYFNDFFKGVTPGVRVSF